MSYRYWRVKRSRDGHECPWTSEPGGRARGMKVAFSCVEQERGGGGQVESYTEAQLMNDLVFYINLGAQCSSELENSYSYRSRNAAVYYNNKYILQSR